VAVHAVYKWFPDEKRTFPTAILSQGSAFGVILAVPALNWLIVNYSWHYAFGALGVVGLMWVVAWLIGGSARRQRAFRLALAQRLARAGDIGLETRPGWAGPRSCPTRRQRNAGWLEQSPCDFGFATERWTAPRVAGNREPLGVRMNHGTSTTGWPGAGSRPKYPSGGPANATSGDPSLGRAPVAGHQKKVIDRRASLGLRTKAGSCCSRWCGARSHREATRPCCGIGLASATRSRWPRR